MVRRARALFTPTAEQIVTLLMETRDARRVSVRTGKLAVDLRR